MSCVTALSAFGRLSVTMPAAPRRANRMSEFSVRHTGLARGSPRDRQASPRSRARCAPRASVPHFSISARVCAVRGVGRGRFEHLVDRNDHEQRPRPVGARSARPRATRPSRPSGSRPTEPSTVATSARLGLHRLAARVARLPFGEQRAVVEVEPRRLLGHVHVDRRAREDRGGDQRQVLDEQASIAVGIARSILRRRRGCTL